MTTHDATLTLTFDELWQKAKDTRCAISWKNAKNEFIEGHPSGLKSITLNVPPDTMISVRIISRGLIPFEAYVDPIPRGSHATVHAEGRLDPIKRSYFPSEPDVEKDLA